MVEFTGERVIPGEVNADLWSEHLARYAFARRFAAGKWVLDAGCGSGYGTAELAQAAAYVFGADLAPAAAAYARETYPLDNVAFAAGSCESLPFADGAFDMVAAFEVIEHLSGYAAFIREAARVLTPGGLFLVSTPNKSYYAESRAQTGPNPYHVHEFEVEEFHAELSAVFANVALVLQNRVESFAFHPSNTFWPADARIEGGGGSAAEAHFFVAVCSNGPLPEMRSFSYVPKAANVLRERERHIQLLESQLERTKTWLADMGNERDVLLDLFRKQKDELERRNQWAEDLGRQLEASQNRVVELQAELESEQAASAAVAAGYESAVLRLEGENLAKTEWALDTEKRLTAELNARAAELVECVRLLGEAEAAVEERTLWAQRNDVERERLAGKLNAAAASRWLKLGGKLGFGPALREP